MPQMMELGPLLHGPFFHTYSIVIQNTNRIHLFMSSIYIKNHNLFILLHVTVINEEFYMIMLCTRCNKFVIPNWNNKLWYVLNWKWVNCVISILFFYAIFMNLEGGGNEGDVFTRPPPPSLSVMYIEKKGVFQLEPKK